MVEGIEGEPLEETPGPEMVKVRDVVPSKYMDRLPPGAADIPISANFQNGRMEWLPGPVLRIRPPDIEGVEILIGSFPDEGILQELMFVDADDNLAAPSKAVRGESWTYKAGKVEILQALLVGPFTEERTEE